MSRKTLIVGYGNPLRGDDGVGQIVAEAVRAHELAGATIIACHQLTPELAEVVAQSEISVFIDAAADIPPGEIVINQLIDETALELRAPPRSRRARTFRAPALRHRAQDLCCQGWSGNFRIRRKALRDSSRRPAGGSRGRYSTHPGFR